MASALDYIPNVSPVNNLPYPFSTMYIQGKSSIRVDFIRKDNGKAGEQPDGITFQVGYFLLGWRTITGNPAVTGPLGIAGSPRLSATIQDDSVQANFDSFGADVKFIPYERPGVIPLPGENSVICERCLVDGTPSASGEYLWIGAGRKYSSVEEKNKCVLRCRYKLAGTEDYSEWGNLLGEDNAQTDYVDMVVSGLTLSARSEYVVQIGVEDAIGDSHILTIPIPADSVPFHLGDGGRNVAFGQYCDYSHQDAVDIGWKAYFNKGIGVREVFAASTSLPWKEGNTLDTVTQDYDALQMDDCTIFLCIAGGVPILCVRWDNKIIGSVSKAASDGTVRSWCVEIIVSSDGVLTLTRCYRTPADEGTASVEIAMGISALYALL